MLQVLTLIITATIGSVTAGYVNPVGYSVPLTCDVSPFSWNQTTRVLSVCPGYGSSGSVPDGYIAYEGDDGIHGYRYPEPKGLLNVGSWTFLKGETFPYGVLAGYVVQHSPYRKINPDGTSSIQDVPTYTIPSLFGSAKCTADYCTYVSDGGPQWVSHALFSSQVLQLNSRNYTAVFQLLIGEYDTEPGFVGSHNSLTRLLWSAGSCDAEIDDKGVETVASVVPTGTLMFNFLSVTTDTQTATPTTADSDYYYGVATWAVDGCGKNTYYKSDGAQKLYSSTASLSALATCSDEPVTFTDLEYVAYRQGGACTTLKYVAPSTTSIASLTATTQPLDESATITHDGVTYTVSNCSLQTSM